MTSRYTRLFTAVAVVFMLAGTAFAQKQATMLDVHIVNLTEDVDNRGDAQLVRQYDDGSLEDPYLGGAKAGGFIFGTNGYGDLGKSVALHHPNANGGTVLQVNAYAVRSTTAILPEFTVSIYNGDEFSGPVSELMSYFYDLGDIAGTFDGASAEFVASEFIFDEPIEVSNTFHVAFTWDSNYSPDDLGFWSTPGLPYHSPYEWEQWDNGTWFEVATAWTANGWHVFIEALVTGPVSNEPGADQEVTLISSVYPNPSIGLSHFTIEIPTVQDLSVEVFNLLGQRVATVFDGTLNPGRMLFDLNTADLTAGMYIVRVKGEGISQTRRFVVAN